MAGRRLTRSTDEKWIAGVCGGIAEYTGVDATVVRLVAVVLAVVGVGSVVIVYLLAWLLMPTRPGPGSTIAHEPPAPSR